MTEPSAAKPLPAGLPPSFHLLAKPTGSTCNLDCAYCFFLEKEGLYPDAKSRMTDETQELYIRQLLESHRTPEVNIAWQGGEPTLMGLEFFRRAVELGKKYARPGQTVLHTIQTNGTKIDAQWARFFAENGFLVGLSIDGPRELHDAYRRDKGGKPTFDKVMRGLAALREHGVAWNALTTVNAANEAHPVEVYRFLRDDCGCEFVQFIPIVERPCEDGMPYGSEVTERSVSPQGWGDFLNGVFDEWVRRDVGQVFVQLFDVALANWYGEPSGLCVHTASCGAGAGHGVQRRRVRLRPLRRARLPARQHPRAAPRRARRRARAGAVRQRQAEGAAAVLPSSATCASPATAAASRTASSRTPDDEPGLNYLCPGYKAFFHHIDAPMKRMCDLLRQDRAPADIVADYSDAG